MNENMKDLKEKPFHFDCFFKQRNDAMRGAQTRGLGFDSEQPNDGGGLLFAHLIKETAKSIFKMRFRFVFYKDRKKERVGWIKFHRSCQEVPQYMRRHRVVFHVTLYHLHSPLYHTFC